MEKMLLTAAIFLVPTLLLVTGFKLSGRRVEWVPLLWSGLAYAVYMTLLRSRGVVPEPAFMAELSLNWYGKGLAILGTLTMLYYLPGVSFRAAGVCWKQTEGSLGPVVTTAVMTILSATIISGIVSTSPNTTLEWLAFQATMPGLDEELFMRGLLLLLLHQAFGKNLRFWGIETGWGLWLTTLLFGLLHGVAWTDAGLALNFPAIVMTGTIGFVEGWLRERSGSLVAPILFHNGFNLAQSFV